MVPCIQHSRACERQKQWISSISVVLLDTCRSTPPNAACTARRKLRYELTSRLRSNCEQQWLGKCREVEEVATVVEAFNDWIRVLGVSKVIKGLNDSLSLLSAGALGGVLWKQFSLPVKHFTCVGNLSSASRGQYFIRNWTPQSDR